MTLEDKKDVAMHYKNLYNSGLCTREDAKEKIKQYLDEVNLKSKELAKKYNQKHKEITFSYFIR